MKTGYSFGSLASFVETINNTTVKLTGDQTIAGIKTFSSNPISSAAQGTGGSHLTRKDYVDGALALKAPLASPELTGVPTAPTAAAGTNTTQVATTAFVQSTAASIVTAKASSATPLMDGTATAGTSTNYAREGHVHPTDTSRAPLASPALTGTPTSPTQAQFDSSTNIATNEFVQRALGNKRSVLSITANTTLLANDVGAQVYLFGDTYYVVVVCDASTVPPGSCYSFVCTNIGSVNLYCERFQLSDGSFTTAINLKPGDTAEIVSIGGSWFVCGGSVSLRTSSDFSAYFQ